MDADERIKQTLADMARAGAEPVHLIRWLRDELGDGFTEFTFTRYFFEVFDAPLSSIRRATAWTGLPYGSYLSDDEVNAMLAPLTVKGDPTRGVPR